MPRKRNIVEDFEGRIVPGLSCSTTSRGTGKPKRLKYYHYVDGKRRSLGDDKASAIHRLRMWEARQQKEKVVLADPVEYLTSAIRDSLRVNLDQAKKIAQDLLDDPDILHKPPAPEVDADLFWMAVRDAMLRDPREAAMRTGIAELGYLERLDKPKPPLKLKEALTLLLDRKIKRITAKEKSKLKAYWRQFSDAVGVDTLDAVSQEGVSAWEKTLDGSPKTVRHKVTKVRTILRYANRKGHRECSRVLSILEGIDLPETKAALPQPIKRADFHRLLDAADPTWRAILLTALNACYYGTDLRTLPWNAVDFDTGEVVFIRHKTGVPRVAMLWGRTIEAIKTLPPHDHPTVFVSGIGNPWSEGGFRKAYDRLKAKIGVKAVFSQIRDGAYTAAVKGGIDLMTAKMLAGHETGQSDAYVLRSATMAAKACEAIERAYF